MILLFECVISFNSMSLPSENHSSHLKDEKKVEWTDAHRTLWIEVMVAIMSPNNPDRVNLAMTAILLGRQRINFNAKKPDTNETLFESALKYDNLYDHAFSKMHP